MGSLSATMAVIRAAIIKRSVLTFAYKGDIRVAQPYILGWDDAGEALLSAVQISGGSGSGFRTFRVSRLSDVAMTAGYFRSNHPDYNPRDPYFARIDTQV